MTKKKRTEYPSYFVPQRNKIMLKMQKWSRAKQFLVPFIREQTTNGLVLTPQGIDLSKTGPSRILKKATLVHFQL
jgi:hypothetical protein